MTFNWPDIPFSGTEVDAFVAEYKIVAEELYYNYPYDSTELSTPYVNDAALKKYLEYGLIYAAFIVKQRAGNSGPGTDFILGNSPFGPTFAMNTPAKRKYIMQNLGYKSGRDYSIAGDSSTLSRREYSDIRRVNGGHKDYFEESVEEYNTGIYYHPDKEKHSKKKTKKSK